MIRDFRNDIEAVCSSECFHNIILFGDTNKNGKLLLGSINNNNNNNNSIVPTILYY